MRKLLVLAAAAASFAVHAQTQVDAPGKQATPNPDRQTPPANPQAPATKTEEERIRAEGAAGGTQPVPPEKRKAVGAGAGPHKRDHLPSPQRLPGDEPVEPQK